MVERLNLKLGIDYLPSQAALPAVNQVVLPTAVLTRVCVRVGWLDPPLAMPRGRWHLIPWLKGMLEQVSAWYQVFPVRWTSSPGSWSPRRGCALQGETVGLKSCRHASVNIKPLNVLSS